jgi:serine protease
MRKTAILIVVVLLFFVNFNNVAFSKQDEINVLKEKISLLSINQRNNNFNIIQEPEKELNEYVQGQIIVKFKDKVESKKVDVINLQYGTSLIYKSNFSGFQLLKIPNNKNVLEMVELYSNNIDVEYAEPNYIKHICLSPNDPYYNLQWHLHNLDEGGINMEPAWDIATGSGVIVAVIDSGITQGTDLAGTCFVSGYDFVNDDNDPSDDNGHGTHIAGTITQSTNNNLGVCGVAFDACLMPIKVLNSVGEGTTTDEVEGIYYAVNNGANILSLSLAGPPSTSEEEAVAYAYYNNVTVIAASGNDNGPVSYPAAYDAYVIAIGATRYDKTRAWYSNFGSSLDLVAPGGDTSVDQNNDGYADGVLQQSKFNGVWDYYFLQGTSMATPHVSGVAALIYSMGVTSPDDIRNVLESSAVDLGTSGWDPYYGHGLINAYDALQFAQINNPPVFGMPSPTNGSTGNQLSLTWSIPINDPEGNLFSWTIQCSDGQTNSGTGETNGTKSLALSGLAYSNIYTVWVNATDPNGSSLYTRGWYTFTTKNYKPSVPTNFTATAMNETFIELTWTKGQQADTTYIERNSVVIWNRGEGTLIYNETETGCGDWGLLENTHYYYQAWSWNQADGFSNDFAIADAITINQPPYFYMPRPSNGSTNILLSQIWSIQIYDFDGDTFNWTIECSNGQNNSGTGTHGTKSLSLTGLAYLTTYKVWVNATDPTGSGLYTREWYIFTTKSPGGGGENGGWTEMQKLLASDGDEQEYFSHGISISGDTALIGAYYSNGNANRSGSVYVFNRIGTSWVEQTELVASDSEEMDAFGGSVSLDGDTALIGACQDDDNGYSSGSAYIFIRTGTIWNQQAKLLASDSGEQDAFGWSVSLDGDTALIGTQHGKAYILIRNGTNWSQQAEFSGGGLGFGWSVSLSGDTALIGSCPGSAYVFIRTGTTWTQQQKLTASDGTAGDQFGYSVSLDGDTALIGANWDDDNGNDSGSAYVFIRSAEIWTQQAKLLASDGKTGTEFGSSVSLSNETALIGAPIHDQGRGSAYVYTRNGTTWIQKAKLVASDGLPWDGFSLTVSLAEDTAIIGAIWYENAKGAAYVFTKGSQNQPPIFETPIPVNNSINNPLSFTWNIPINDPEGNLFSWTIQCSDGQTNSGSGETNGTKSLALSGLAYSATYKVWVNATDPTGSALWTQRWYTFTTKSQSWSNRPPTFSSPSPTNGSTSVNRYHATNVTVSDLDGNLTTVCFWYSTSNSPYSWTKAQQNNSVPANTTVRDINSSYSSGWNTQYWWKVTAYDSHVNVSVIYSFTTKAQTWVNRAPVISSPSPSNGSVGVPRYWFNNVTVSDADANQTLTVCFWNNSTAAPLIWKKAQQNNSESPLIHIVRDMNASWANEYSKKYWWKVTVDDGTTNISSWYCFTTKESSDGGGGSSGGGSEMPPAGPQNKKPVANVSAGEPYQGFVNTEITFDGSRSYDPDGNITKWFWVFGDNFNGTGKIVNHTYSKAGTYNVILTVTDNKGATNTDTTTCVITQPNRPPSKPIISGPTNGTTNTTYNFTAFSTDPDNDTIKYTFNWGAPVSQSSGFLPNGTSYTVNHSWSTPGEYILIVSVTDNQTVSSSQISITIVAGKKEQPSTPGFELVFILCAIAVAIFLWRKKQSV